MPGLILCCCLITVQAMLVLLELVLRQRLLTGSKRELGIHEQRTKDFSVRGTEESVVVLFTISSGGFDCFSPVSASAVVCLD